MKPITTAFLVALFGGIAGYLIASGLYVSFDITAWVQSTREVLYPLPYAFRFLCSPANSLGIPCSLAADGTVVIPWYDAEDMAISMAVLGILLLFVPSFLVASRIRVSGRAYGQAAVVSLFLVSTAFTLYFILAPWVLLEPVPAVYVVASSSLAVLFLFFLRLGAYQTHRSLGGSASLALLDVLAYVGLMGVAVWSFVFPIIHPFPPDMMVDLFYSPALPIGVYSLIFFWAVLIIVRVALVPFTGHPSERPYARRNDSLRKLTDRVSELERNLEEATRAKEPRQDEKMTFMLNEISAVKQELASLKERKE